MEKLFAIFMEVLQGHKAGWKINENDEGKGKIINERGKFYDVQTSVICSQIEKREKIFIIILL